MSPWRKSFGIWVPDRSLRDERGFISPALIGAVAGSRRRTAATCSTSTDTELINSGTNSGNTNLNTYYAAAKFSVTSGTTITEFFPQIRNLSGTGATTFGIYTDSSGSVGSLVSGTQVVVTYETNAWAYVQFTLSSPVTLPSGTNFWLLGHSASTGMLWGRDATGGTSYIGTSSPPTTSGSLLFSKKIYGCAP